jgi:hypothetical protein
VTQAPAFTSPAQAAALARASLRYLAAADPAQMSTEAQAACLHDLERITAVTTAARANVLGGFTASPRLHRGRGLQPEVLAHP